VPNKTFAEVNIIRLRKRRQRTEAGVRTGRGGLVRAMRLFEGFFREREFFAQNLFEAGYVTDSLAHGAVDRDNLARFGRKLESLLDFLTLGVQNVRNRRLGESDTGDYIRAAVANVCFGIAAIFRAANYVLRAHGRSVYVHRPVVVAAFGIRASAAEAFFRHFSGYLL
jgi:hypothetical protein